MRTYKIDQYHDLRRIKVLPNDDIVVYGDFYLFCTDNNGRIKWANNYLERNYYSSGISITSDGGYLLCAQHTDSMTNAPSVYLIKTDSLGKTGCSIQATIISDSLNSIPYTIVNTNRVYSSDTLTVHPTVIDSFILSQRDLCFPNGIEEHNSNARNIVIIKPNPFATEFELDINSNSIRPFNLELYDLFGKKVYSTTLKQHIARLDFSWLMDGAYILRLENKDESHRIRIVKLFN